MRLPAVMYPSYLKSAEWARKRGFAIFRAGGRCAVGASECTEVAREVHHRTYDRMGYELPQDLMAVCRSCHQGIHAQTINIHVHPPKGGRFLKHQIF